MSGSAAIAVIPPRFYVLRSRLLRFRSTLTFATGPIHRTLTGLFDGGHICYTAAQTEMMLSFILSHTTTAGGSHPIPATDGGTDAASRAVFFDVMSMFIGVRVYVASIDGALKTR